MKILSFAQALSLGFQPRKYGTSVPEGEFIARLDLRMWGKSVKLRCFFTNMKTGEKFSLFAYRSHSGKEISCKGRMERRTTPTRRKMAFLILPKTIWAGGSFVL